MNEGRVPSLARLPSSIPCEPSIGQATATTYSLTSTARWLSMAQSGHVLKPPRTGEDGTALVLIAVSSTDLASSSEPYTSTVSVELHLPTGMRTVSIPVQLFVLADPVASSCTLSNGTGAPAAGQPSHATLFEATPVARFIARDLQGLQLDRFTPGFTARLFKCDGGEDSSCFRPSNVTVLVESAGDGEYAVEATLTRLGSYRLEVYLNDTALPFTQTVVGACRSGQYAGAADICVPCPRGVVGGCGAAARAGAMVGGATLATLDLKPNEWRISDLTADIRTCNTDYGLVATQNTSCAGGSSATGYCYAGMEGPMCQVCIAPDQSFDATLARCLDCPRRGVAALALPAALALLLAAAVLALVYLAPRLGPLHPLSVRWRQVQHSQLGLVGKGKLCVAYYQVVVQMPEVFDVPLPSQYYVMMRHFDAVFNFDWLQISAAPACVGDFGQRLGLTALVPLVLLAAFMAFRAGVATMATGDTPGKSAAPPEPRTAAARRGWFRSLPLTLLALFSLVPSVCSGIFSAFDCEAFSYDDAAAVGAVNATRSFLHADYAVSCDSEAYDTLKSLVYGLIVLWPIGVPAFFGALLYASRRGIRAQRPTALYGAVNFLCAEYRPELFWWELLELMRKLTLTGFLLLATSTYVRLVAALLLSIGYLVLLLSASPYKDRSTAVVALATNLSLVCAMLAALLLKMMGVGLSASSQLSSFGFSAFQLTLIIIGFNFGVIAVAAALVVREVALRRGNVDPRSDTAGFERWASKGMLKWVKVGRLRQLAKEGGELESWRELPADACYLGAPPSFATLYLLYQQEGATGNTLSAVRRLVARLDSPAFAGGPPEADDGDCVFIRSYSLIDVPRNHAERRALRIGEAESLVRLHTYSRIRLFLVAADSAPSAIGGGQGELFGGDGAYAVALTLSMYCQRLLNPGDVQGVSPQQLVQLRSVLEGFRFESPQKKRRLLATLLRVVGRLEPVATDRLGLETAAAGSGLAWLKPGYIYELAKVPGPFPRRQDLKPDGLHVGMLPPGRIFSVSHGWASEMHPCPSGRKMRLLAEQLRTIDADPERDGVFLDYCSLNQKQHDVPKVYFENAKTVAPQLERIPYEVKQFGVAMWEMSRVYAYRVSEVIVLPEVEPASGFPGGAQAWGRVNPTPYHQRGWCCAEYAIANFHGNIVNADDEAVRQVAAHRVWPDSVEAYTDMMDESKENAVRFTSKGDSAVVQYNFFKMCIGLTMEQPTSWQRLEEALGDGLVGRCLGRLGLFGAWGADGDGGGRPVQGGEGAPTSAPPDAYWKPGWGRKALPLLRDEAYEASPREPAAAGLEMEAKHVHAGLGQGV